MKYSNVEELKASINIVEYIGQYVPLRRFSGGTYKGLCPFHQERTPSFCVDLDRNYWHCFGCGVGGDIFDFIMGFHKVSFPAAVERICKDIGAELAEIPSIITQLKKYEKLNKGEKSKVRTYLIESAMEEFPEDHNITEWIEEDISYEILKEHNVRYDTDKTQILFPIYDEKPNKRLIAIKSRTLMTDWKARGIPKYTLLGKMGEKDFLYGWQFAHDSIKDGGELVIFEAEKSVMKFRTLGMNNSVAAGSHFISPDVERLIISARVKNVVFAYDKGIGKQEVLAQTKLLKHFCNCYYIYDRIGALGEKDAPIDKGLDVWNVLYKNRVAL